MRMDSKVNGDQFFNTWALITGILQILDYNLNVNQISNDEILKHLQLQDKIINEEINTKLYKIIKQNELIIKLLNTTNDGCEGNDCNNADNTI